MRIIRGFSQDIGYSCNSCHLKCCATEYNLPLLAEESIKLRTNYRTLVSPFLKRGKKFDYLLRGDSCLFLNENGKCNLHDTPEKPLICHIYPLIYWKINEELTLSWINPCRGNGFNWIADEKNKIQDKEINDLYEKSKDKFKIFIGDVYDRNNPYEDISVERINEELKFLDKNLVLDKNDFLSTARDEIEEKLIEKIIKPIEEVIEGSKISENFEKHINSVFHWLCWSPVGLQLSLENSKSVFLIASLWIKKLKYETLSDDEESRTQSQLSSLLATAILPSFWRQVSKITKNDELKIFSKNVANILEGKIPQQDILEKL